MTYDLVIRGGLVVDGSGGEPRRADVAVIGSRIAAIGTNLAPCLEEIDAMGCIVTPGFVDIHTHYDGQVTWTSRLQPSSAHGVTTLVIGNCGIGFAPCRPADREQLIRLMEGVEDIPNPVLTEGLPWNWQSFPDYLDAIEARSFDVDVAALVPHAALRVFVMGDRGARREPATAEDRAAMAVLVRQAIEAGAVGVGTSRTMFHRSSDGELVPTLEADEAELRAMANAMGEAGEGVFQLVSDFSDEAAELAMIERIAAGSGRPVTFTAGDRANDPGRPKLLNRVRELDTEGLILRPQALCRPTGAIIGHQLTLHPFCTSPTYRSLASVPFDEKIAALRRPEIREAILGDLFEADPANALTGFVRRFDRIFPLADDPDYEPAPEDSIAARAATFGVSPESLAYDTLLEKDGKRQLYLAISNYDRGNLDGVGALLADDNVVLGLGDGGAHCGSICDASCTTYMLTHWVRDRKTGRLPIEHAVRSMTHATAEIVGLRDRGLVAEGFRADLNVIDLNRLRLFAPEVHFDLPAGGRRLLQKAEGYRATILAGQIVARDDCPTGALPGRLVRGAQIAPDHAANANSKSQTKV
jgi:N-acyl-D-aspartate/D-glutamate deacylase